MITRLRDHCHYTSKYIGAAHSICNLKYNIPKEIRVASHDYNFILVEQAKEFEE